MKVIVPVAGIGSRLAPFTYTLPKVLLPVAGKPILGHILSGLEKRKNLSEVIFIIGHLGELIRSYISENFNFPSFFIEQEIRLGLGHAIHLARIRCLKDPDEPVFVILGDTLLDLENAEKISWFSDAVIGVKEVPDPRRFGIAEVNNGYVTRLVEKPDNPSSNLALVGLYYFRNSALLFSCLDELIARNIRTRNEFQLTDAMSLMLDKGARIRTVSVYSWFDCGKTETLLETNRELLKKTGHDVRGKITDSVIIPPVYIDSNTVVTNSVIGPYVSVTSSEISNSVIKDSIINRDSRIENTVFSGSLVGQGASILESFKQFNIGDSSQYITGYCKTK